jgi:hypothetical protein
MVFPIVAPPNPRGPWFEQTWIYIMSKSFHGNLSSSDSVVLEKILKCPHPIFAIISALKRAWSFIWTMNFLYPRMICTKLDWNWLPGSGEDCFSLSINTRTYGFHFCGPSRPPGAMIGTNLNPHYSCISVSFHLIKDQFWLSDSWEDF